MEFLEQFVASLSTPLQAVTADSRLVQPGAIFVAIPGATHDGHVFIPQAIERGAQAVVGERPAQEVSGSVPYLAVPEARFALAYLAALQHNFPARRMRMIGVTGTDGKTTTANLLYHILRVAGLRAGMISTVNAVLGDRVEETGLHVTTPEAPQVQRYLADMVEAGISHCVLETTSHGLAQHRASACDFDIAVVTNITHEHLDYHGNYDAYRAAKAMLFESLLPAVRKPGQPKVAVLNGDDSSYSYLCRIPADRQIVYSMEAIEAGPADLLAQNPVYRPHNTSFELFYQGKEHPIVTHLVGSYNVSNVLAAVGAALALEPDIPMDAIQQGVEGLAGIPGRMEVIKAPELASPFSLVVDFAHTPNALRRTIETGRQIVGPDHQVITVFGSAGLRDVAKRRMMAEISARHADRTILTAEDPRTESLETILEQMAAGCKAVGGREGRDYYRVADRLAAITFALELARPGDMVLVCGKGHEQSMCFGEIEYPWDDREAAHRALAAFLQGGSSPPSGLPTEKDYNK